MYAWIDNNHFLIGTLFQAGLFIVLLTWKPHHGDITMFYVVSGCLGICDAIWQTQTNCEYDQILVPFQSEIH